MLPDAATLVTALVDATLKGLLILGLAAVFALWLRRASAASRHWVWTLALASMIALPMLTPFVPAWQVPVLPERMEHHLRTAPLPPLAASPSPALPSAPPETPGPLPAPEPAPPPESPAPPAALFPAEAPVLSDTPAVAPAPSIEEARGIETLLAVVGHWGRQNLRTLSGAGVVLLAPLRDPSLSLGVWVLGLWLLGLTLMLGRMLLGAVGVRTLLHRSVPVTEHAWLRDLTRWSQQLGLTRPVALRRSLRTTMPLTCGVLRPFILLPAGYADWSPERRRVVLLHELAHIRRRDCLTQRIGQLSAAVFWFNPFVWIAVRLQRMEHERACDDLVLSQGTRPSTYAQELLDLARAFVQVKWTAPVTLSVAHRPDLERRMQAILDPKRSRRSLSRGTVITTLVLVVCLLVPAAALHFGSRDTATREVLTSPRIAVFAEPSAPPAPVAPAPEPAPEGPFCTTLEKKATTASDVRIDVQNTTGRIAVEPGADVGVTITAETCAPTAALLEETRIVIDARLRNVMARTQLPRGASGEDIQVRYLLRVPPAARLNRIDQQSGEIHLAHLDGPVSADLKRGALHAVGLSGEMRITTLSAAVDVELGDRNPGASFLVESVSGPVVLRLTEPVSADLHARTVDGSISNTLGLNVSDDPGGHALRARLGHGGTPVMVRSVQGAIRIEGPEDGRLVVVDQTRDRLEEHDRGWRRAFRADESERFEQAWEDADAAREEDAAVRVVRNDADPHERMRVLEDVARLEEPRATRLLSEIALHDPSDRIRLRALHLLGGTETPATHPVLVRLLTDSSVRIRVEAARVLGARRDPSSVDALGERALHDGSAPVRIEAIRALGHIGDFRAKPILEAALDDRDRRVRRFAERVLRDWERTTWIRTPDTSGHATYCRAGDEGCAAVLAELRNLGGVAVEYGFAVIDEGIARLGEEGVEVRLDIAAPNVRRKLEVWVENVVEQAAEQAAEQAECACDEQEPCEEGVEREREALVELQERALVKLAEMEASGAPALRRIAETHPDPALRVRALELIGKTPAVSASTLP